MSALDDQRRAAAADLYAHREVVDRYGALTLVRIQPDRWPRWLHDVINLSNTAALEEARGCAHLAERSPQPVGTSPAVPGMFWCASQCMDQVLRLVAADFPNCDGCGVGTERRVRRAVVIGHVVTWLHLCRACNLPLMGDRS